jgi:two-component system NarL family sensor kinase
MLLLTGPFRPVGRLVRLATPAVLAAALACLSFIPDRRPDVSPTGDGMLGRSAYGSYFDRLGYPPETVVLDVWGDGPAGLFLPVVGSTATGRMGVPLRTSGGDQLRLVVAFLVAVGGCLARRRAPLVGLPIAFIAVSVVAAECLFATIWPNGGLAFASPVVFVALVAAIPVDRTVGRIEEGRMAGLALAVTIITAVVAWFVLERFRTPFDHVLALPVAAGAAWLMVLLWPSARASWAQARRMVRAGWYRDIVGALSESAVISTERYRLIGAEEERRRLSDELHAEILPRIGRALRRRDDPSDEDLQDVERHLREMLSERQTVVLDALGLSAAIDQLAAERRGRGCEIITAVRSHQRPPGAVELVAYRIAQQAMDNAITHARASRIEVETPELGASIVTLIVRDDGVGIDASRECASEPRAHLGLLGMEQAAGSVGGTILVRSDRSGTEVRFRWRA